MNCNYCGQITDPAREVRADKLVFCDEEHSQAWYNREVAKETEALENTDARPLMRGLIILWNEFPKLSWNIAVNGETIIVWDSETEKTGCETVSNPEALKALGWFYDEAGKGWSINSPIY